MSLKDLNIKEYYNNDESDLVKDFYNPIFNEAVLYKRASGFFSSSSFWSFIDGLKNFIDMEGKIRLIISPELSDSDIEAIMLGEKAKEESVEGFLISKILEENKYEDQFNLLAWLIYEEKLEIKIVVKKDFKKYGIFHDKFAVVSDSEDNKIVFHGSLNESGTGILENFEAIDVYRSWSEYDKSRIKRMDELFDKIWNNETNKWEVYDIPESLKNEIIKKRQPFKLDIWNKNKEIIIPEKYKLREYQENAIKGWFENSCQGILEMATGSGKTLTAIFAMLRIKKLFQNGGFPCGIVIVVPSQNLLEQWCEELSEFNIFPIRCYIGKNIWEAKARIEVANFNKYEDRNLYLITTNATYISNEFQTLINSIKRNYIFCADEMHHLSAPKISKLLPENTNIKLGLTATLANDFEEEKSVKLIEYFDGIVYKFNLEDAIKNDCLTKYYYYPIFIELTFDEIEKYKKLTNDISRAFAIDKDSESVKALLNKRRRIIFNAENKINKLISMKDELRKYNKLLVYCGDKIDDSGKYVDKINLEIRKMGLNTHTYTSSLNRRDRENILKNFKNGKIDVLTAIRCLDEGVDIPTIDCAFFLSSNSDSKQFIQRRGRVLRKSKGKQFAYIYDFIVVPSLNKNIINDLSSGEKSIHSKIVCSELKRVYEFAGLCQNKVQALSKIAEIIELYI